MRAITMTAALIAATASMAEATPRTCARTIIREARLLHANVMQVRQKCESANVFFERNVDCGREGPFTHGNIAELEAKFRRHVESRCRNEVPADVGWGGSCPDFQGKGCTNVIADIPGVVDCMLCIGDAAQSEALDLYYRALDLPSDHALNGCQRAIGERAVEFFGTKIGVLGKCELRNLSLSPLGPCPDGKGKEKIEVAEQKMRRNICAQCGGRDHQCDGNGDFDRSEIGFVPTCPAVTLPDGSSCASSIASAGDVGACTSCFTEFVGDCLDALAAPTVKPYPLECR
jgi:hypothetical protein